MPPNSWHMKAGAANICRALNLRPLNAAVVACRGECLASSRQPAGSEGELACGGEQKNVCIIKMIKKTLIFITYAGYTTLSASEVVAEKTIPFDTVFPHCVVYGDFLDGGVVVDSIPCISLWKSKAHFYEISVIIKSKKQVFTLSKCPAHFPPSHLV